MTPTAGITPPSVKTAVGHAREKAREKRCPACRGKVIFPFFELRDVPVNCTTVFETRERALSVPLARLNLAFCEGCGYIYNTSFDPSLLTAEGNYEDQQVYSPTFNAYSEALADSLIRKYALRGVKIVEIGCGKGDFLSLLCRRGNNRGVGIDPIGNIDLQDEEHDIRLIPEYYAPAHGVHTGRLIVCRHTLEHVPDPCDLIDMVYGAIPARQETVVFIEVPDVVRILRENAFWDIYYEHCGYFSPGSMARLFRHCGFEVTNIERVFHGQYITLEAVKSPVRGAPAAIEESTADLHGWVVSFVEQLKKSFGTWNGIVAGAVDRGEKVAVWGSGSKCVSFLSTLGLGGIVNTSWTSIPGARAGSCRERRSRSWLPATSLTSAPTWSSS